MIRRHVSFLFILGLFLTRPSAGADSMKQAIASLPADAVAFVCVPHFKQLDANAQQLIKNLGLEQKVQLPGGSLTMAIKSFPPFGGLDENGTLAFVLMPFENAFEIQTHVVVVVPTADPKAMVEGLGGQAGEGSVWNVNMMGQQAVAVLGEKRVYFAQTPAVAAKIAASKGGLDAKVPASDIKSLDGLDIAVWVDGERVIKVFKPQIDALMAMAMMMQGGSGPMGARQAEAGKQYLDTLLNGLASFGMGLSLKNAGVDLRFIASAKSGSEFAQQLKVKTTTESLFRGLPGDRYVLAFGQIVDPSVQKASMKYVDPYFDMLAVGCDGVNKEQVEKLKTIVSDWAVINHGVRGVVQVLPDGADGVFGATMIFDTPDSKKWVDLLGAGVDTGKKLYSEIKEGSPVADAKKVLDALTHTPAVEQIAGVSVGQVKFDLTNLMKNDDDREHLEDLYKIVGKDGLMLRVASVDPTTVVLTFGGGTTYTTKAMEAGKKKEASLDSDPGIKKVAAMIPQEKQSALYVAFPQLISGIKRAAKAVGGDEIPFTLPSIDAPLAVFSTGGDSWVRMDLIVPSELLVAGKDAFMAMQGGGEPTGPSGTEPSPGTADKKESPK